MSEVPYFQRPPFGFIVEGTGEYLAYPSIVARIVKESGFNIPRVNAGGFAQVVHHLEEHLSDIVATYKPLSILITVDLIDVLYNKTARDCSELISILHGRIGAWSRANEHVVKFQPFPEQISVVIQIQTFESWIIADKFGLRDAGFINLPEGECDWGNVDTDVKNPSRWLDGVSVSKIDLKHPQTCKQIVSRISLDHVKDKSLSFNKFFREVTRSYRYWREKCTSEEVQTEETLV